MSICTDLGRCAYDVAEELFDGREAGDTPCPHWNDCFPGRPVVSGEQVTCPNCRGLKKVYPPGSGMVILDDVPGYDPRLPCSRCEGTGHLGPATHSGADRFRFSPARVTAVTLDPTGS